MMQDTVGACNNMVLFDRKKRLCHVSFLSQKGIYVKLNIVPKSIDKGRVKIRSCEFYSLVLSPCHHHILKKIAYLVFRNILQG